jgi:iron complex transport system permease protein
VKKMWSWRMKGFSILVEAKALWTLIILAAIALLVVCVSVGVGDMYIAPQDVLKVFLGWGNAYHTLVVETLRLPRVLIALLSGAGLAVSGAILQAVIRNPLASPDLIGITGGATVAAVAVLTFFSDGATTLVVPLYWVPLAAFGGAMVVALLMYLLSLRQGITPFRLILLGIGFYTAMQAFTNLVILLGPEFRAVQSKTWITGSVYGSNWEQVMIILPWMVIFLPLIFFFARHLNVQQLGDQVATGLGGSVHRDRVLFLFLSTALTGASVAFAGGISFVGLLAPHAARKLVGSSYGALLPASALLGSIYVMLADLLGRTLYAAHEIPAGVFTAVIGAPYFIYLLIQSRNRT